MSDNAVIVAYYAAARLNNTTSIAVAALLVYDYLITFDSEVELFWTGASVTAAPLLFYTTRYLGLLSLILDQARATPVSLQGCDTLVRAGSFVNYLQDIPVGAFSGLRVFALSKGNRWIALIVFVLSIVPLGTNMSLFHMRLAGVIDPVHGCGPAVKDLTLQKTIILATVTNAALILANAIIIAVTWITLGTKSFRRPLSRGTQRGFAAILFWNGTMYFIALSLLAFLHVTFTVTSIFGEGVSAICLSVSQLSSILVWRFMIDLQAANQSDVRVLLDSDDSLCLTEGGRSMSFARAIGSIGATITSNALGPEDENQATSRELGRMVQVDAVVERCLSRTGWEDRTYQTGGEPCA